MNQYHDLFDKSGVNNCFCYDPNKVITTSMTYPHSPDHKFESYIEFIDFDKECEHDIETGNGFILGPATKIKEALMDENGIYSSKFGQTLADVNPFMNRYRCNCRGENEGLKGRLNAGLKCPKCGKVCRFVDDNFSYFGWMKLADEFVIIHPAFYKKIEAFLGTTRIGIPRPKKKKRYKIENILEVAKESDTEEDIENKRLEEPFFAIGMIEFHERFDEIMNYYLKKKSNAKKRQYYADIYENREKIFIHSIPVFSALLRGYMVNNDTKELSHEPTNAIYSIIHKHVTSINKNNTRRQRDPKTKKMHLYKLQLKMMELYDELENILSGKKGDFRCLLGGRYNFSSRNVIVQNPDLRIDEITLPVIGLTILLEQRIKNILCRIYNMTPTEAHAIWYKACIEPNPKISAIIQSIIDDCKAKGMPGLCVLINRNPTITYGSMLQMFCIGFTDTYTMAVPLQILKGLNADFDGDVLNILLPVNQTFMRLAWEKFNPRNAMYISRNDGYFNSDVSMQKDTVINANTLARCGREYYTPEEQDNLCRLFELKKQFE